MDNIEELIVNAIIERPKIIVIKGKRFAFYPPTLGKTYLVASLVKELELNEALLKVSPLVEMLRVSEKHRGLVARIIAYAACKDKAEVFDPNYVTNLTDEFSCLDIEDLATLLNVVLTADSDTAEKIIKHYEIDKEYELIAKAQRIKSQEDNSLTFCGKTIWGSTIDYACERYGWTVDYVLWGVSWVTLQMLMADNIRNVYLTADERKKMHVARPGDEVYDVNQMTADDLQRLNIL